MHADQLLTDGLDEQSGHDGRVNTAAECQQHLLVAHLGADSSDLLVDKGLGQLGSGNALHGFGTNVFRHNNTSNSSVERIRKIDALFYCICFHFSIFFAKIFYAKVRRPKAAHLSECAVALALFTFSFASSAAGSRPLPRSAPGPQRPSTARWRTRRPPPGRCRYAPS